MENKPLLFRMDNDGDTRSSDRHDAVNASYIAKSTSKPPDTTSCRRRSNSMARCKILHGSDGRSTSSQFKEPQSVITLPLWRIRQLLIAELPDRNGAAKQITLQACHLALEVIGLLSGLDPFCHQGQTESAAQVDHVVDNVFGERLRTDPADEGLIDLEEIYVELLQIEQTGVAGAKIIHRQLHSQRIKLFEQLKGVGIRHQQLPLGQLEYQDDLARLEAYEEVTALIQQHIVAAMSGTDVESYMETIR